MAATAALEGEAVGARRSARTGTAGTADSAPAAGPETRFLETPGVSAPTATRRPAAPALGSAARFSAISET